MLFYLTLLTGLISTNSLEPGKKKVHMALNDRDRLGHISDDTSHLYIGDKAATFTFLANGSDEKFVINFDGKPVCELPNGEIATDKRCRLSSWQVNPVNAESSKDPKDPKDPEESENLKFNIVSPTKHNDIEGCWTALPSKKKGTFIIGLDVCDPKNDAQIFIIKNKKNKDSTDDDEEDKPEGDGEDKPEGEGENNNPEGEGEDNKPEGEGENKPAGKPTRDPKPSGKPTRDPKPTGKPTRDPKPSGKPNRKPKPAGKPKPGSKPTTGLINDGSIFEDITKENINTLGTSCIDKCNACDYKTECSAKANGCTTTIAESSPNSCKYTEVTLPYNKPTVCSTQQSVTPTTHSLLSNVEYTVASACDCQGQQQKLNNASCKF